MVIAPSGTPYRAGGLTAGLTAEDLGLRDVRVHGHRALDAVYVAVRNEAWRTVPGVVENFEEHVDADGFTLRFTLRHSSGPVDFRWEGTVRGRPDGVTYTMDGVALGEFRANRIGFCLLHPLTLKGRGVTVRSPGGTVSGRFPVRIAPHQPFVDVTGMTCDVADGVTVDIDLTGDLFEVEDHRNWTDAGWKTYCTPLRLPYPVTVRAGQRISQSVTLRAGIRAGLAPATTAPGGATRVTVGSEPDGVLPRVGLGVSGLPAISPQETDLLRRLRPDHLQVEIVHGDADWADRLGTAAAEAAAVGVPLDVLLAWPAQGLAEPAAALAALGVRLGQVAVYDPATHTTAPGSAARLRSELCERGVTAAVGGGSRAYFAELNRADLPLTELDFVTYSVQPQVHHTADASVMDTLAAQPDTVTDALRLAEGRSVVVGPVTLRARCNFYTATPQPPPDPLSGPDIDPRQPTHFAAAWTAGTLAGLRGAAALTLYRTVGPRGVVSRGSRTPSPTPTWQVLAWYAGRAGAATLPVTTWQGDCAALAVRHRGRTEVLVANLRGEPLHVDVDGVTVTAAVLLGGGPPLDPARPVLPPHGVAVLDTAAAGGRSTGTIDCRSEVALGGH